MRLIKLLRRSPGLHAALGFASLLVLTAWASALIGAHPRPDEQQKHCNAECVEVGMQGQLQPSELSMRSNRGNTPLECKCVWYRTR